MLLIGTLLLLVFLGCLGYHHYAIAEAIEKELRVKYGLDEIYVSMDRSFIGIRFDTSQLILGKGKGSDTAYKFSQLTSVEVIQDGVTITSANRGSQLMGGAVGALAFGGIGAVVGGLTGSTRAVSNVRSLSLQVMVDCRVRPCHLICFADHGSSGYASDTPYLKIERARIERFHAHILNAMRQTQATVPSEIRLELPVDKPRRQVPAGDLQALWELKEKGILTENEFQQQKARLLE